MSDYDMTIHRNPSSLAWAKFFMECNPNCGLDEEIMTTWFANAMTAMHDHMRSDLAPVVLPDGSAVCIGL